jgi:hypothetical protein
VDDEPILVITVTSIPGITTVHLYEETLLKVQAGHPEVQPLLPSIVTAVSTALTEPTWVEQDRPSTYVIVDESTTNAEGDPLRVAIKVISGTTSARVSTFYFASTEGVANIVWRRGSG